MSDNPVLKDLYKQNVVEELAACLSGVDPDFPAPSFVAEACTGLEELEFKDRVRQIARAAAAALPTDFPAAAQRIRMAAQSPPEAAESSVTSTSALAIWPLCQVVQEQGLEHFEEAMATLHVLTKQASAEFAIRPFLDLCPGPAMTWLKRWAGDPDARVRRLVSEGTRPRLPWAPRLKTFADDHTAMLPLLEQLRDDPDEAVRRSVANHLNDITKDHPDLVVQTLQQWSVSAPPDRQRLIRHALRTLVKKGHPGALAILGVGEPKVRVTSFTVAPPAVAIGGAVEVAVAIVSAADQDQELLVDFAVHYRKARGDLSPKVFKWTQRRLAGQAKISLRRQLKLVPRSTRRLYPGEHRVELLINGQSLGLVSFELRIDPHQD